jgi:hypothetical protein
VNVGGGSYVDEDGEEHSNGGKWIEMIVEGDQVYIVCDLLLTGPGPSDLMMG